MRKIASMLTMFVSVLMMSCYVLLHRKRGPPATHINVSAQTVMKAALDPVIFAHLCAIVANQGFVVAMCFHIRRCPCFFNTWDNVGPRLDLLRISIPQE